MRKAKLTLDKGQLTLDKGQLTLDKVAALAEENVVKHVKREKEKGENEKLEDAEEEGEKGVKPINIERDLHVDINSIFENSSSPTNSMY